MVFLFNFEQQRPYSPSIIVRTNLITTVNWAFHRPGLISPTAAAACPLRTETHSFYNSAASNRFISRWWTVARCLCCWPSSSPPAPPYSHPFMFIVKDYSAKPSTLLLGYVLSAVGYSRSTEEALWEGIADLDLISFNEMESPLLSTHWPCNGHRH